MSCGHARSRQSRDASSRGSATRGHCWDFWAVGWKATSAELNAPGREWQDLICNQNPRWPIFASGYDQLLNWHHICFIVVWCIHGELLFFPATLCGVLVFRSVPPVFRLSRPHLFVTHHLSHTSLSHAIFVTQFVTHTHLLCRTICHTKLCHTPSSTYIFATHHFATHNLPHTSLSHTIFHTQLCHTHNFVAHHLSHTSLSHTIFYHTSLSNTIFDWHLVTSTLVLRGRRGTYGTGLGLVARLGPLRRAWRRRTFAWQAWHLVTSTFVLRGRRGIYGTSAHATLAHTIFFTTLSHSIFHTQLCHTPSLSHTIIHKPLCTTLSHTIFYHTSLSHTIFHPHLCHTATLSHTIFVTHHLSHTIFVTHHLSHTSFTHHLCPTPSIAHIFHTPSLSQTSFVANHLSHTIFVTLHLSHTHNFVTRNFVTHTHKSSHISV